MQIVKYPMLPRHVLFHETNRAHPPMLRDGKECSLEGAEKNNRTSMKLSNATVQSTSMFLSNILLQSSAGIR